MPRPSLAPVISDPFSPDQRDVVVIGGGIVGVCTALFLADRGLRVTICEKGQVGGEQSSRNWGFVRQMGRDPVELPLAIRSLSLWRDLKSRFEAETGFRQTGIMFATQNRTKADKLAQWAELGHQHGLDTAVLERDELDWFLGNSGHPFLMGLHTGGDGRAEPGLAAPALAEAARKRGVKILTHTAVRGVEQTAGRVSAVMTEYGTISCDTVVVAAGMWSRRFIHLLGMDFPQLPLLGSVARIETSALLPDIPFAADDWAIRKREDGGYTLALRNANIAPILPDSFRLLPKFLPTLKDTWREVRLRFGQEFFRALREPRVWEPDVVSPFERIRVLDPEPHIRYTRQALARLADIFPDAEGARITHDWGGMIDATPDALPVIGPVSRVPGLFLVSGFSGHGFGVGPAAGELMADLITCAKPNVDPTPFSFERF